MIPLIDSHVHLDMPAFDGDREGVLERSRAAGIAEWIVPGLTPDTAGKLLAASWRTDSVHVAVGIHPHEVAEAPETALGAVAVLAADRRVVAIGETGLDYHYGAATAERQRRFLEEHFAVAERTGKPLIVHTRDGEAKSAYDDILAMIEETSAVGVLHSFTGTAEQALRAVESGWRIGVGGIVTFKNGSALREAVRRIPLDRILLETDAPYLAPVPHRGARNEPAFLVATAGVLANIFGMELSKVAQITADNTKRLFFAE